MKKVMVFGTFDILHPGHVHMLNEAKKYGDYLVAVIARDQTVGETKGKTPRNDETTRLIRVQKLGIADKVVFGSLGSDKHEVVREENPDVIALGYDQKFFIDDLETALKDSAQIVKLTPHMPEAFKSSKLPADYTLTYEEDPHSHN